MKQITLWIITILIIGGSILTLCFMDSETASAAGSVFSAAGGFTAVVWFYSSLKLQSEQIKEQQLQIKEQRQQFQLEFDKIQQESKRASILLAKEILRDMEEKVEQQLQRQGASIESLHILLLTNIHASIKTIIEEENITNLQNTLDKLNKLLIPARTFLQAFKYAASIILENKDIPVIDDNNRPEWFVITYEKNIQNIPFVSNYFGTASMLAHIMTTIKMEIIEMAQLAVIEATISGAIKEEGIKEMIQFYKENPQVTPKVVINIISNLKPKDEKD